MKLKLILLSMLFLNQAYSQVSVSDSGVTADPSAMLDVVSEAKGFLVPRMTIAQRNAIVNPAHALLIFQTDIQEGFYYNGGTAMAPIWSQIGSDGTQARIPIDTIPYTINNPGSYYLTAYLTISTGAVGITINTSNVSIDFNGFGINGNNLMGTDGVKTSNNYTNISIYNGSISNWAGDGIDMKNSTQLMLSHVFSSENGLDGITVADNAIISHSSSYNNGADGFDVANNSILDFCLANGNGSDGFDLNNNSTVSNCTSTNNASTGFYTSSNTNITHCNASNNNRGFLVGNGSIITHTSSYDNNAGGFQIASGGEISFCTAKANTGRGFSFGSDCHIFSNTANNNTTEGFYTAFSGSRIEKNSSNDNGFGFKTTSFGNLIVKNYTTGNTLNWSISANNLFGTILNSSTINTNTNPNANIEY